MIQNDIAWNYSANLPPAYLRCEVRVERSGKIVALDYPVRHQDGWQHAFTVESVAETVLQWRLWSGHYKMPREARNKPVQRGQTSRDWFARGMPGELVNDAIRGKLAERVREGLK